jgi:putative exporter of polyketide antibiotics
VSYSDPPPPPPQYGAPQPGYGGMPQKTNSKAIWSLVLGILGLVCCGFVTGIPAIILGNMAKKEIAQTGQPGHGMAQAGFVLGIIAVALGILGVILYVAGVLSVDGSTSTS